MRKALRDAALQMVSLAPISSLHLGPPKRGVWDLEAQPWAGIERVTTLEHRPTVKPSNPWHCAPGLLEKLSLIEDLKELQVAEFRDGRYYQPSLAVVDNQDHLAYDYTQVWQDARWHNAAFECFRMPPATRLPGKSLLLDSPAHGKNYFHWLIEGLPRLGIVQAAGYALGDFDHFLITGPLTPIQKETLDAVGFPFEKMVDCSEEKHVVCERLVASTNAREHLYETSRNYLRSIWPAPPARPTRRIYISRADAGSRRIVNEAELTGELAVLGFETVTLTGMTVRQQRKIFSEAAVVVAPHGAALANLVFFQPGSQLIEIQFPRYMKGLYWRLADRLNIGYATLEGVGQPGPPGDASVTVPQVVDLVKAALDRAVQAPA